MIRRCISHLFHHKNKNSVHFPAEPFLFLFKKILSFNLVSTRVN